MEHEVEKWAREAKASGVVFVVVSEMCGFQSPLCPSDPKSADRYRYKRVRNFGGEAHNSQGKVCGESLHGGARSA